MDSFCNERYVTDHVKQNRYTGVDPTYKMFSDAQIGKN